MRRWNLRHYAISGCVTAALLAGCGGSQPPIGAPGAMLQTSVKPPADTIMPQGAVLLRLCRPRKKKI